MAHLTVPICIKTLAGKTITLDADPQHIVQTVTEAVFALHHAPQQKVIIAHIMAGVTHGGFRLFSQSGDQIDHTLRVGDVPQEYLDSRLTLAIRKRFDDALNGDDRQILNALVEEAMGRIDALVRNHHGVPLHMPVMQRIVDAAFAPPPAMTLTHTVGTTTMAFDVQLILGNPIVQHVRAAPFAAGLNMQGLTYVYHEVHAQAPAPAPAPVPDHTPELTAEQAAKSKNEKHTKEATIAHTPHQKKQSKKQPLDLNSLD